MLWELPDANVTHCNIHTSLVARWDSRPIKTNSATNMFLEGKGKWRTLKKPT